MASVFKRGSSWLIKWKDSNGKWRTCSGGKDKTTAKQISTQRELESRKLAEGLISETELQLRDARRTGITDHVSAWYDQLLARGNTTKHATLSRTRVLRLIEGCGFKNLTEVTAEKVNQWLADRRQADTSKRGFSSQTSNFYLTCFKSFLNWCAKTDKLSKNPVAYLNGINVKTDRRHDRRNLSQDEMRRLIEAARASNDTYRGMTGEDRALLYQLTSQTGLRASELKSLTVASFRLNDKPSVTVQAAYAKNKKQSELPLRQDTAEVLAKRFKNRMPAAKAFNLPNADNICDLIIHDLAIARQAWLLEATTVKEKRDRDQSDFLKYKDSHGRYADFHSLRHTFISEMAIRGVHPKIAQQLARHSSITLTLDRYTHVNQEDMLEAVNRLPEIKAG